MRLNKLLGCRSRANALLIISLLIKSFTMEISPPLVLISKSLFIFLIKFPKLSSTVALDDDNVAVNKEHSFSASAAAATHALRSLDSVRDSELWNPRVRTVLSGRTLRKEAPVFKPSPSLAAATIDKFATVECPDNLSELLERGTAVTLVAPIAVPETDGGVFDDGAFDGMGG